MANPNEDAPNLIQPEAEKPGGIGIGKVIGLVVVAIAATFGAAAFFLQPKDAAEPAASADGEVAANATGAEKDPPLFVEIEPAFTVNLADDDLMRYMQAEVQVMSRDQAALERVGEHMPVVRNRLLMLFGQQTAKSLSSTEGKQRVQDEALVAIAEAMEVSPEKSGIEAVYFTSLIIQ